MLGRWAPEAEGRIVSRFRRDGQSCLSGAAMGTFTQTGNDPWGSNGAWASTRHSPDILWGFAQGSGQHRRHEAGPPHGHSTGSLCLLRCVCNPCVDDCNPERQKNQWLGWCGSDHVVFVAFAYFPDEK